MMADDHEGDIDAENFDDDSYGSSLSDYDDDDNSALIEIPLQNLIPAKGNNSANDG